VFCAQCGKPLQTEEMEFISGHAWAEEVGGERVEDSWIGLGLFHRECWEEAKERLRAAMPYRTGTGG
jgi:hypothetical protein